MSDLGLRQVVQNLHTTLERDTLVQVTLHQLRLSLKVERVVLYYFYRPWEGQVTFESLEHAQYSIFGSKGPDECFNGEYAAMYEAGRVRAIADIETEPISQCHRDFLKTIQVRANLVAPVLNHQGLWGLLIAHACVSPRSWLPSDLEIMVESSQKLATSPAINRSRSFF